MNIDLIKRIYQKCDKTNKVVPLHVLFCLFFDINNCWDGLHCKDERAETISMAETAYNDVMEQSEIRKYLDR